MEYFSKTLIELIKASNKSQKQIAEELGLSKNQIHYWTKNKAEPDLEMLKKLSEYFDVSVDYLLGRD